MRVLQKLLEWLGVCYTPQLGGQTCEHPGFGALCQKNLNEVSATILTRSL